MGFQLWDTAWTHNVLGTSGDWILHPAPPLEVETREEGDEVYIDPNSGGLQATDPLGTAILIALFSDARLPDSMLGRFGFTRADQHEWHGNTFSIDKSMGEEPLGSLLWTLKRAPLMPYSARLAEHFCAIALQPLVRQGWIGSYAVESEIDKAQGRIDIWIRTYEPTRHFKADITPLR